MTLPSALGIANPTLKVDQTKMPWSGYQGWLIAHRAQKECQGINTFRNLPPRKTSMYMEPKNLKGRKNVKDDFISTAKNVLWICL